MFFVSMLLNELLGWMRTQSGTTSLRAILYMDEVFGYFPPVSNPPSKTPLLRLLKQARAFGLGVVLATQNPVDLDYRGLSNTGTWLIGRLQTERDQMRVMDGLQGGALGGKMDAGRLKPILAGLKSRTFLLHNVHESGPVVFQSRWALSYLRGPLTRDQIKQLNFQSEDAGTVSTPGQKMSTDAAQTAATHQAAPSVPPDIPVYFIRGSGAGQNGTYVPHVFGQMAIYYSSAKYQVDLVRSMALAAPLEDGPYLSIGMPPRHSAPMPTRWKWSPCPVSASGPARCRPQVHRLSKMAKRYGALDQGQPSCYVAALQVLEADQHPGRERGGFPQPHGPGPSRAARPGGGETAP